MGWNNFFLLSLVCTSTLLCFPSTSSRLIGEEHNDRFILEISSDTTNGPIGNASIRSQKTTDSPQPTSVLIVNSNPPSISEQPSSNSKRKKSYASSDFSVTPTLSPTIKYEPNNGLQTSIKASSNTIASDIKLVSSFFDHTDAPSTSSKPSSNKILTTSHPSTSPEPSGSMILITGSPSISPSPTSYSKVTGFSSNAEEFQAAGNSTFTPTFSPTTSYNPSTTVPPSRAQIETETTTLPTKSPRSMARPSRIEVVHDFMSSQPVRTGSSDQLSPTSAFGTTNLTSVSSNPSRTILLNTAVPTISPEPSTALPTISPEPSTALPTISPKPSTAVPTISPKPSTALPTTSPKPSTAFPSNSSKPSTVVKVTSSPTLSPTTSNVPFIRGTTGSSENNFPTSKALLESEITAKPISSPFTKTERPSRISFRYPIQEIAPTLNPIRGNMENYNGLEAQDDVNADKETTSTSNSSETDSALGNNTKFLFTFILAVASLIITISSFAVWRILKRSQENESHAMYDATTGHNLDNKNANASKACNNNSNNSCSTPAEEQAIAIHPDISNQMFQFSVQISEDKSVDGTDCWSHQASDLPSPYYSQRPT